MSTTKGKGWINMDADRLTDEEQDGYQAAIDDSAVHAALRNTDWALLAEQKLGLLGALRDVIGHKGTYAEHLTGLLHFLDALQDAAVKDGLPVVFLTDDEPEGDDA